MTRFNRCRPTIALATALIAAPCALPVFAASEYDNYTLLGENETYDANRNGFILGSKGQETVRLTGHSEVSVDANIERLEFSEALQNYQISIQGTLVVIEDPQSTTTLLGLNNPVTLAFIDGSATLTLTGLGNANLGGSAIPGTPSTITTELNSTDPSTVTPGGEPSPITLSQSETYPGRYLVAVQDILRSQNAAINKVEPFAENHLLLIGEFTATENRDDSTGFFVELDGELNPVRWVVDAGGYADLCVHPSGQYTLARFVLDNTDPDSRTYNIRLEKYSQAHEPLSQVLLTEDEIEPYYELPYTLEEYRNAPFTLRDNNRAPDDSNRVWLFNQFKYLGRDQYLKLNCDQESVLVTYNFDGFKLTQFDANLFPVWHDAIMHFNFDNNAFGGLARITQDAFGNVYTISSVTNNAIPSYNHRFNTHYTFEESNFLQTNLIIRQYTPDGVMVWEKLIGSDEDDIVVDAVVDDQTLFIGTHSRILKHPDRANNTTEWDIGWFQFALDSQTYEYQFLDFDQEDQLKGIFKDGDTFYLYGLTAMNQVDTNSWVSYGHAFYMPLEQGQVDDSMAPILVKGDRFTEIRSLTRHSLSGQNSQFVWGGATNAPITHSADFDSTAFIGLSD
ncbi:hypothetical protein OLMES_0479 [Oleiphilus messinensis]|uniref:Uncharacterized protein n=1 Tax=Oleiphilus messinensis TaxID=141451 RepID=A0A1Y0I5A6_9GAMM|nr:hypothetical protein [Oleiphilus messinensis]ARU54583.1 hypothetical protein OLMES_0479 [Oleiphilus messinensis]